MEPDPHTKPANGTDKKVEHDRRAPAVLRRDRTRAPHGPGDYEVLSAGRVVGRIFHANAGVPQDRPWMWTVLVGGTARYGFEPTLDGAKAAFAAAWRS